MTDSEGASPASLLRRLRSAARSSLDAGERLLHPLRRRRARRRLSDRLATGVTEVVFVCHGNICRSPFAERAFLRLSDSAREVPVRSSGFYPEPDRSSPPEALAAARRRGVDLEDHRSAVLDEDAFGRPEDGGRIVLVMDANQRDRLRSDFGVETSSVFVLGDLDPEPIPHRRITDPWGADPEVFDRVFGRIERCVRDLVAIADDLLARP